VLLHVFRQHMHYIIRTEQQAADAKMGSSMAQISPVTQIQKVSALVYLPCKATVYRKFENCIPPLPIVPSEGLFVGLLLGQ
jgi:hypothetical protein